MLDKKRSIELLEKDKSPPLINILPEKLTLVDDKIIQKFGEKIFLDNEQQTLEKNQESARKKPKFEIDNGPKRDVTPTRLRNSSKTME